MHRLPDATHLGRVVLQVSDLAQSRAYYEDLLGLRTITESAGALMLGAQGSDAILVELRTGDGVQPLARPRLGLYHFAILLPTRHDLGRFVRHLAERHVRAGTADHLVSEALYLQDPDNLGIEVYADRSRDRWQYNGGELAMASDPLDIASLVAAAGDAPWTGMPAGTVIGHVHLHVGDLDEGARFYHDALGLDKVVWSYPGALFLSAGGYHHHLGTNTWARGAVPAGPRDAQLLEWHIVVPADSDVAAAADSLARAGAAVTREGDSVRAADPWGTTLRLTTAG
jgi:catechol 2,3-dioxygenase